MSEVSNGNRPVGRVQCILVRADRQPIRIWAELEEGPEGAKVLTTQRYGSYLVAREAPVWLRYRPMVWRKGPGWLLMEGHPQVLSLSGGGVGPVDSYGLKAAVRSKIVERVYAASLPFEKWQKYLLIAAVASILAVCVGFYGAWQAHQTMEALRSFAAAAKGG